MRPLARYQSSQAEHEVFVEGLLLEARLRARILVRPDRLPPLMVKACLRQLPGTGLVFFGVSMERYWRSQRGGTRQKTAGRTVREQEIERQKKQRVSGSNSA